MTRHGVRPGQPTMQQIYGDGPINMCIWCYRRDPPCGWAQPMVVYTQPPGLLCQDCKDQQAEGERVRRIMAASLALVGGD